MKYAISLAGAAEAGQRYPVRSLLEGNIMVWYGTGILYWISTDFEFSTTNRSRASGELLTR